MYLCCTLPKWYTFRLLSGILLHYHLQRIEQGWKFGTTRDDKLKQTPCLVPYEELTEEEKDYDRNTSQETLRLILKLGYRIEKD